MELMELAYAIASHLLNLPALLIALFLFGFLVHVKKTWLGTIILGIATALLVALSLPLTAHELMAALERYPAVVTPTRGAGAPQAIVVLGGGRYTGAPEYGGDTVNPDTLVRLRYAVRLHRETGLPILVTGGAPFDERTAEAELMSEALTRDFKVPVRWTEMRSRNTTENALYTRELLRAAGVKRVYLVTQAHHMRRAVQAFVHAGLDPLPAPTGFTTLDRSDYRVFGYLPSANALRNSSRALHERAGYWWHQMMDAGPTPRDPVTPAG
jgi:uncharacterized SAM-binding protein YcdF (DUF218 family)